MDVIRWPLLLIRCLSLRAWKVHYGISLVFNVIRGLACYFDLVSTARSSVSISAFDKLQARYYNSSLIAKTRQST